MNRASAPENGQTACLSRLPRFKYPPQKVVNQVEATAVRAESQAGDFPLHLLVLACAEVKKREVSNHGGTC